METKTLEDKMVLQLLLIKKQQTLEKYDEEILGFLTEEDDIETEIEFASQFADEIIEAITKLKWDADYIKKKDVGRGEAHRSS